MHAWINDLLGYGSTREALGDLEGVDEGFDGERRSGVLRHLDSRSGKLKLPLADLERYDENVRRHLGRINHHRPEPVVLRYFQHLAALYTEIFLDRWSTDRDTLAVDLDAFAAGGDGPTSFAADDLNKLAFWMATGSGKTLLLHLNYWQFLHYVGKPPDNVLLITPNAGLTEQHLGEMRKSGIPCGRFSAGESGLGLPEADVVRVIEITKLTGNKKGGGESVDVGSFEGRSLIFMDEGHKGAGGGKDANLDKAWRPLRDRLAEKGFTFEYSATFGQAIQASRSRELAEEYGKAILFDYSYRHFYEDGYGKDFSILNLKNQAPEYTDVLLLGNLLSFHEQRLYYRENREALEDYRLESPLWVFVGSSVNKAEQSDIGSVVRFLNRFLKNDAGWSVGTIGKFLGDDTGLQDGDGRDAFAGRFEYLKDGSPAREVYDEVLRGVFHAGAGGTLRVADIKGSEGELGLKVSGAERYFGLIYIGDTGAFKRLLDAEISEVVVEEDVIVGGLFGEIDRPDSGVNVLIGARKFIEGWSSWRVSNMGLLNIGKSEGSQIIPALRPRRAPEGPGLLAQAQLVRRRPRRPPRPHRPARNPPHLRRAGKLHGRVQKVPGARGRGPRRLRGDSVPHPPRRRPDRGGSLRAHRAGRTGLCRRDPHRPGRERGDRGQPGPLRSRRGHEDGQRGRLDRGLEGRHGAAHRGLLPLDA